jgi:hypothetical protein
MYKIIGEDGKEYGPVSREVLRQWLAEGRVNGQTKVLTEGATAWRPLAEVAELAALLGAPPTISPIPTPMYAPQAPRTNSLAVMGLICGILSVTCGLCCYGLPFNLAGILFSILALSQINKDPRNQQGRDLALIGLVLSFVSLLLVVLLATVAFTRHGAHLMQHIRRL